jgi:hypothetical protein
VEDRLQIRDRNYRRHGGLMKLDMNLVREILLRLEPLPNHFDNTESVKIGEGSLKIEGYSKDQIAYHLRLMAQGNLIQHGGIDPDNGAMRSFGGLRWQGHSFINHVRKPNWPRPSNFGAGRRMSNPRTPPKKIQSDPLDQPMVNPR